jgi:CO/xanthine dehydrogenase Mo-binding subunit
MHPAGMQGGGDPSQAQIRLKADGTFDLLTGAVDIGQGSKTALRQIAAEELGAPLEAITHNNFDSDIAPLCTGTFASRVTFHDGNAVIQAVRDLKTKMKAFVAGQWEVEPEQVEVDDNKVFLKDDPSRAMTMAEVGGAANWGGEFLVGLGAFLAAPGCVVDPETGKMPNVASYASACCVAEVEVDTGTGVVTVLKLAHAYEIGRAINPLLCKGQIHGGATMGIGMALTENINPDYPSPDPRPHNFSEYILPTASDMPGEQAHDIVEIPHPNGPYGAKGFSESSTTVAIAAILNAIHDAVGVWVTDFPATPEMILQALTDTQ